MSPRRTDRDSEVPTGDCSKNSLTVFVFAFALMVCGEPSSIVCGVPVTAFTSSRIMNSSPYFRYRMSSIVRSICDTACSSYRVKSPTMQINLGEDQSTVAFQFRSQLLHGEKRELSTVIEKPVEIEQPLVDYIFLQRSLVLDDDRRVVLIDAKGVDSARRETLPVEYSLAQQTDPQERLQMVFHQYLEDFIQRHRRSGKGGHLGTRCTKQLDVTEHFCAAGEVNLQYGQPEGPKRARRSGRIGGPAGPNQLLHDVA